MTSRRCHGCGVFYDKKAAACPDCATSPHPFNAGLAAQRWASNLNAQANRAVKDA